MTIEDLVQLLNNRLREFQLSRDYAKMRGDLENMNAADKEIISLKDTLFKLNLLIDTSKSAAVKEKVLAEVITDGSVAVLDEYDITSYATDPLHEEKVMNILSKMAVMDTAEKIDDYIKGKYLSSPVTGEMVMSAAKAYEVDARLMMAIMEQDSRFGTVGIATSTLNPGNVGNDDSGNTRTYDSWQEGVTAVAEWLSRHRGKTIISEIPEILDMATSTPSMATSTPMAATSTPVTATSTPIIITPTATSTPPTIATTTPMAATSTPITATSTPVVATSTSSGQATSTPEIIPVTTSTPPTTATTTPVITTSTTTTATTTPATATSTPIAAISTPIIITPTATSTPEITPEITSTTTTTTATSTPLELTDPQADPTSNGAGTATTTTAN